jgi:enoyl-[acyl-carrier protein] reductase I
MSESQKTAVIFGLANKRSIAWAIAQKLAAAGWRLAITYQNERLALEAKDLIGELPGAAGFMCDVTQDDQIARLFEEIKTKYEVIHGLVHSVGFAPPDELKKPFVETSREGFRMAHDISVYSLIAVARGAAPHKASRGGIVTLN